MNFKKFESFGLLEKNGSHESFLSAKEIYSLEETINVSGQTDVTFLELLSCI